MGTRENLSFVFNKLRDDAFSSVLEAQGSGSGIPRAKDLRPLMNTQVMALAGFSGDKGGPCSGSRNTGHGARLTRGGGFSASRSLQDLGSGKPRSSAGNFFPVGGPITLERGPQPEVPSSTSPAELTVAEIRKWIVRSRAKRVKFRAPLRDDIRLTVSGVVWVPGIGFLHPETFRLCCGNAAYRELLRRPRVVTAYDEVNEDTNREVKDA